MALIRLWGKSGVLRLPKNEHKEEFFKAPSISCSISFPVTPLLLENDVSKDIWFAYCGIQSRDEM